MGLHEQLKVIAVESTPNPNARKFVLNGELSGVPISIREARVTSAVPDGEGSGELIAVEALAIQLRQLPNVVSVLVLRNFITINKSPEGKWADMTRQIKRKVTAILKV